MRGRLLPLLLALACAAPRAAAQTDAPTTLAGWAGRVEKFGKSVPQEQVFVHMDNTCYFLGDTIYYKVYVRRGDTGAPSRLSGVLYAELLNEDGYLVHRQQLELKNGQAHGSVALEDTLYGGFYELRAYTRWQLNWGVTEHKHTPYAEKWFFNRRMAKEYYRDYEKLYSRVFPVYDKPLTPGDYTRDMTLRPTRRVVRADTTRPAATLRLYPEGGHLVAGAPCRVAFEANDEEGRHLEGAVTVTDGSGQIVARAKTEQRGRGAFTLTPRAGEKYTATLASESGEARQALPGSESDGCALQVTQEGDGVTLAVAARGAAADEALGMTVMNQGVVLEFRELGAGGALTKPVPVTSLRPGVNQITLFSAEGRVWADRLVFLRGDGSKARGLTFTGLDAGAAQPYAPVTMGVEGGVPGSEVSLAVRDASRAEYLHDNGDILSEMLLSSQIRGFVENPRYFFEKDDAERRRALDLLLMVQGWRRYDWHTMATPGAFELSHMPEQTPLFTGEVNNYETLPGEDEFANKSGDDSAAPNAADAAADEDDTNEEPGATKDDQKSGSPATAAVSGDDARDRFRGKESSLKREVLLHAEFTKPGAPQGIVGEVTTKKGQFSIQSPRFYEGAYFFLAAADTAAWSGKERARHAWVEKSEDARGDVVYPEFYVRVRPFFPRFVKPYTYYQSHLAEAPRGSALASEWADDGSRTLRELVVGAKRTGMRKFDASKPAFVLDAYEAFNEACDAGLCPGYYMGRNRMAQDVARAYVGDMGLDRKYDLELRLDTKKEDTQTASEKRVREYGGKSDLITPIPEDKTFISSGEKEKYNQLSNLHLVYVYTDYSPRKEGASRFEASNQPTVAVDLRTVPDEGKRDTYRNRRYVLPGFSAPDDFYQPDYSKKPLPQVKDYRRTLYWNPGLRLDAEGRATVTFYNNGKETRLAASAEGMAGDGTLSSGNSMPEDR